MIRNNMLANGFVVEPAENGGWVVSSLENGMTIPKRFAACSDSIDLIDYIRSNLHASDEEQSLYEANVKAKNSNS